MKNNRMKRFVAMLLALTICFGMLPMLGAEASAAPAWPGLSSSGYCEMVLPGNIPVYRNTGLTTRGTCSPAKSYNAYGAQGDKIYIYSVNGSYAKINYPAGSTRKTGYVSTASLLGVSAPKESFAAKAKVTTYNIAASVTQTGSVAKGDTVYKLGTGKNGYVLVMYTAVSGSRAYKAAFVKGEEYSKLMGGGQSVGNGKYVIVSALDQNKCVDINGASRDDGANAQLYTRNGTGAQEFSLTYHAGGWYTIVNTNSGKALDVSGGIGQCGQNVWQYGCNGTDAQKWYLESAGNGWYYLRSALGFYLDVSGGGTGDGTNIQIWEGNGSNAQKFRFESAGGGSSTTQSGAGYASISTVDYNGTLKNAKNAGKISTKEYNNRVALLEEARKMVTVLWTSPVSFHSWKSGGGSYNSNSKMRYSGSFSSTSLFEKGQVYQGIPYCAKVGNNNHDAGDWLALVNKAGVTKSELEGTVTYQSITRYNTTYRGIDCSGFVHEAYEMVGGYNVADKDRLSCSGMMGSSSWKKISASEAQPGDILLKSGHVMIYLGKTSSGKIAVFESVADGENGASGCRYYEHPSVSGYSYYRFTGIAN